MHVLGSWYANFFMLLNTACPLTFACSKSCMSAHFNSRANGLLRKLFVLILMRPWICWCARPILVVTLHLVWFWWCQVIVQFSPFWTTSVIAYCLPAVEFVWFLLRPWFFWTYLLLLQSFLELLRFFKFIFCFILLLLNQPMLLLAFRDSLESFLSSLIRRSESRLLSKFICSL